METSQLSEETVTAFQSSVPSENTPELFVDLSFYSTLSFGPVGLVFDLDIHAVNVPSFPLLDLYRWSNWTEAVPVVRVNLNSNHRVKVNSNHRVKVKAPLNPVLVVVLVKHCVSVARSLLHVHILIHTGTRV